MDFTLINSFIAVAEEGSFSTAAKHLFLSQQSLSKQIAKLESELGTELLVRSRPLRLTQNGKLFLQTAKEMVKLKQEFEETCGTAGRGEESIHVGMEHTIARAILPRVLPRYMDARLDLQPAAELPYDRALPQGAGSRRAEKADARHGGRAL